MADDAFVDHEEIVRRIGQYLANRRVVGRVAELQALRLGWESRVFAANVAGGTPVAQILRLYYGADGGVTALREHRALLLLRELDFPAPQPLLVEPSAQPLGSPFLMMSCVPGQSPRSSVFRQETADDRAFVQQFCGLLARLHTLDWHNASMTERVQTLSIDAQLRTWTNFAQRYAPGGSHPSLTWLIDHRARVSERPLALVHWDFHHENLLVDKSGQATVIDWTQFQATDPRFDLAWTLTLIRSYAGDEAAEGIRTAYSAALPAHHEPIGDMDWFEAAACAKRLLSVTIALAHGAAALGMRPGAEATIAQGFGPLAQVYRRWLALTGVPLPDVAAVLDDYL